MWEINPKDKIKINYKLEWLTEALSQSIKELTDKNIEGKLNRYLQKIFKKEDSEGVFDISINKNKKNNYEGTFIFFLDGNKFIYKNDIPFKNIKDLVNHAFDHLKRNLADI